MRRILLLFAGLLLIASCTKTDPNALTAPDGTTLSTGTIAGDPYLALVPTGYVAGSKRVVIYLHGATQTEAQVVNTETYPGLANIIATVARAGYPVLAIRDGGDQWGNADARSKVAAARTWAQTNLGAAPGKAIIIGGSMGGANAITYAAGAMGDVACVAGLVPVSDLGEMVARNPSNLAASITKASPDQDPTVLAKDGKLTGLKYRAWYGKSDEIVPAATVTKVVDAIGPTAAAIGVDGDHNGAVDHIPPADVAAFLATC